MGTEIVQYSIPDVEKMAIAIAASQLFGIKTKEQAMALMLLAQAEGRHPVEAARDYNIIQGRPAKTAEAMLRDFLSSGGAVKWHELSDTKADASFAHPQGGEVRIDWDMERAKTAGLGVKDMWKKYPRQMLRSRVISEGVRSVCPAATSGMYVPEEVKDFDEKTMKNVTPEAVQEIFDSAKQRKEEDASNPVIDETLEELKLKTRNAALSGNIALSDFLKGLSKEDKRKLVPFGLEFRKIADEVDIAPINDELPPEMLKRNPTPEAA